jgi:hypothetical protein
MKTDWIIKQVHNRGSELLKTFAHKPHFLPTFNIDYETKQAKVVVEYHDRRAERAVSTQLVCNAPKKQVSDSLALIYNDCVIELMK